MSEDSFYRTEARTILNHSPEEALKMVTSLLKIMDKRREYIDNLMNTLLIEGNDEDLSVDDHKKLLKSTFNTLYEINWQKKY